MNDARKAFRAPPAGKEHWNSRFRYRSCSTPGCMSSANWLIAKSADDKRAVRYACDLCKAKKYAKLEERELTREA